MSEDNEKIKLEKVRRKTKKRKMEYEGSNKCIKLKDSSYYDRYEDEYNDLYKAKKKVIKEKEPLFVEDRTRNFTQDIQFEVFVHFLNF